MYREREILITTKDLGAKDSPKFMPKGSEVIFIKVANPDCSDLAQSALVVEREGGIIGIKESDVRMKSLWRRIKAVRDVNNAMYLDHPRLRRSHHNPFKRFFYLTYYFVMDKVRGEKVDSMGTIDWK